MASPGNGTNINLEMSHIENFTRLSGRTRRGEAGRADVQGDMVKRHGWGCSKHWI